MNIEKYTMGIGDRFGHQGGAQLQAMIKARQVGIEVLPVWNKSYREHSIIGTQPINVRQKADDAVARLGWKSNYYVDADHINLKIVDSFIEPSDFFTLDVADYTGKPANEEEMAGFVTKYQKYAGYLHIGGVEGDIEITEQLIRNIAGKYLLAVQEAGKIYRHIEKVKKTGAFVTEVSMDETNVPQTPVEMLFILAAIADEGIPIQTIAPKFTGRFNKGVDYVGDVSQFEKEFSDDLAVINFAIKEFGLPENLKLSVHSGSDKFSIYEPINRAIRKFDTGLHLKTAGTTWLEELIGLALAGGEGLQIAKEVYYESLVHFDELCGPYATVIDINRSQLPDKTLVNGWDGQAFARALRHDQSCADYNPSFRQLLHVGYKIAAKMGTRYLDALKHYETIIAEQVTENIYSRHILPVFGQ